MSRFQLFILVLAGLLGAAVGGSLGLVVFSFVFHLLVV